MLNKALLVGRLTRDPEMRSTASGISVLRFTVAVPRRFVKQGEERQTDFINCVAFRQTADFIGRYFTKGSLISIDGMIQTNSWDDNEGKRRYSTEVVVNEARFVEGRKDSSAPPLNEDIPYSNEASDELPELSSEFDATDDDLPF